MTSLGFDLIAGAVIGIVIASLTVSRVVIPQTERQQLALRAGEDAFTGLSPS